MAESKPDKELDDLLDTAAKDFEKSGEPENIDEEEEPFDPFAFVNPDGSLKKDKYDAWSAKQDEVIKRLQKEADEEEANHTPTDPEEKKELEAMAADLAKRLGEMKVQNPDESTDELSQAVGLAIKSLSENFAKSGQNVPDGAALADAESIVGGMMQQMMLVVCKEVLYPGFQELSQKYPTWLEEKKSSLDEKTYERYNRQMETVKKIVAELEGDKSSDATHLDNLLQLLTGLQDSGQLPKELTDQLSTSLDDKGIDAKMKEALGGEDGKCPVM